MKNRIVVPIDFSSTSHNAYLYARGLATALGYDLVVTHVQPASGSSHKVVQAVEQMDTVKLNKKLDDFVSNYPESGNGNILTKVKVSTLILKGNVVDQLQNFSVSQSAAFMVIGTRREHNMTEKLLGSVSSKLAQLAPCPTIIVPKGAKYQDFKRILFASNYQSADNKIVKQIVDMANIFRATMHFIHVRQSDSETTYPKTEQKIFAQLFKDGDPAFPFEMAAIDDKSSVLKGLTDYANKKDVDLMVLVNWKRSFLNSILGQSLTQKAVMNLNRPLMVYHLSTTAAE